MVEVETEDMIDCMLMNITCKARRYSIPLDDGTPNSYPANCLPAKKIQLYRSFYWLSSNQTGDKRSQTSK